MFSFSDDVSGLLSRATGFSRPSAITATAASWQSRRFLSASAGLLEHGAWDDVLVLAERLKRSPVATIYTRTSVPAGNASLYGVGPVISSASDAF